MARPGPKPGSGGRPRTKTPATRPDGYVNTTVGPKSKGVRQLEHRVVNAGGTAGGTKKAPVASKGGPGQVVDHKNQVKSDNRPANLRRVSKGTNNRHEPKKQE